MESFKTHNGRIVKGEELKDALNSVADDLVTTAHAIRTEDDYASHVSEADKDILLKEDLELAERVREGDEYGLWLCQRLNTKLTGECIAMLQ